MYKYFKKFHIMNESPIIDNSVRLSLYKKSQKSGISLNILEEVYKRGFMTWNESSNDSASQLGFSRLNSFISNGFASELDADLFALHISEGTTNKSKIAKYPGHNISMEEPWNPGDPNAGHRKNFKKQIEQKKLEQQKEEYTSEPVSKDFKKPNSRFFGSTELTNVYKNMTPGQNTKNVIKKIVKEIRENE